MTSNVLAMLLVGRRSGYLSQVGWLRSFRTGESVDRAGRPLPWYPYAATAFLEQRVTRHMSVFEYGSGSSTLWWSERVSRVVSCEHDRDWYERLRPRLPPNVEYMHVELEPGGDYSRAVSKYSCAFDVIVIDGRDRVACALNVPDALKPDGVIVWDDSDRQRYAPGCELLNAKGFARLDFTGLGPIRRQAWRTTVYYRPTNCLGI